VTVRLEALGGREQQDFLLDLLNTTPVADGAIQDRLAEPSFARTWQKAHGGSGSTEELRHLVEARDVLQAVIGGRRPATALDPLLAEVDCRPQATSDGIRWELHAPAERRLAAQNIAVWGALVQAMPGRLRACANTECHLFLIDRSNANSARWCSMTRCGNRMKARSHYQRTRNPAE
jgi:predicted RNA-binding Zn ribbon-like protein